MGPGRPVLQAGASHRANTHAGSTLSGSNSCRTWPKTRRRSGSDRPGELIDHQDPAGSKQPPPARHEVQPGLPREPAQGMPDTSRSTCPMPRSARAGSGLGRRAVEHGQPGIGDLAPQVRDEGPVHLEGHEGAVAASRSRMRRGERADAGAGLDHDPRARPSRPGAGPARSGSGCSAPPSPASAGGGERCGRTGDLGARAGAGAACRTTSAAVSIYMHS